MYVARRVDVRRGPLTQGVRPLMMDVARDRRALVTVWFLAMDIILARIRVSNVIGLP